uniref:Secreted protein n=1 Tax=Steinernema glaseri TaxID=37863 RepID=A0A1I7ZEV2_9BILA
MTPFATLLLLSFSCLAYGYKVNPAPVICQRAPACITQYLSKMDVATPPYPGYIAIVGKKQEYLADGPRGLDLLCQWNTEFQSCMSDDPQCLQGNSSQYLASKLGIDARQAELYEVYFAENVYECSDGKQGLLDNLQCFKDHRNQSRQIIQKCFQYNSSYGSDRCQLAVSVTECLRDGFRQECGLSAGEFMCNEEKVALGKSTYADCAPVYDTVDCKGASRVFGAFLSLFVLTMSLATLA